MLTSCPKCDGDGVVGIFIDNESIEDVFSFLLVGIGAVVVIAGVASAASSKKPTREVKVYTSTPKTLRQPPPSEARKPTVLAICPKCKNRIASETKFCPECGTNLQRKKTT